MAATTRSIPRPTPFQTGHPVDYALRIISHNSNTGNDMSVRCQFCVYSGRETGDEVAKKRQCLPTARVMDWNYPFRTKYYVSHHTGQHPAAWEAYQALSYSQKQSFFENKRQFSETLHHHFGSPGNPLIYIIDSLIVNVIIADMFFHPSEHGGTSQTNALKLFKNDNSGRYSLTISNRLQFQLVIDHVSTGCSFRQVARILDNTKRRTGLSKIGTITDAQVANLTIAICAINLQLIAKILQNSKSTWAWSLANDSSTHFGKSYLDNRVRFHLNGTLHNIHVIAIPMHESSHTGQYMFDLTVKIFDILCPNWRTKLLGIGSDGASVLHPSFHSLVVGYGWGISRRRYET